MILGHGIGETQPKMESLDSDYEVT